MSRPSSFTQSVADLICEQIADGKSLRSICLTEEMPNKSTVFRWLADNQPFRDQYALAREAQADSLFEDSLDIADDGSRDYQPDADGNERVDHDHIARSRLRVDTRKWMAGKLRPKKYGERLDLTHANPDGTTLLPPTIAISFAAGGPGFGGKTEEETPDAGGTGTAQPEA